MEEASCEGAAAAVPGPRWPEALDQATLLRKAGPAAAPSPSRSARASVCTRIGTSPWWVLVTQYCCVIA